MVEITGVSRLDGSGAMGRRVLWVVGRRGGGGRRQDRWVQNGGIFFFCNQLSGIAGGICMGAGIIISRKPSGPVFWWSSVITGELWWSALIF